MYVSSYSMNSFGLVTGGVGKRSRFLSATIIDIGLNNFYLISGINLIHDKTRKINLLSFSTNLNI